MSPRIEALIAKGRRSLAAARRLADAGDDDFAVSRAYYAMFYLAEALLLSLNLEFSRHSAVVTAFQQHFVRPGALGREHYDAFRAGFELRQTADYGVEVITTAREAGDLLRRAEAFVEAAEALLRRSG